MCGFVGFLTAGQWARDEAAPHLLAQMANTIVHRGPDSAGYWHDAASGIALGHRRLAIVDLSPAGAQPMQSACVRYVLAFNGEVYNHLDLRKQLGGSPHPRSSPHPLPAGEGINSPDTSRLTPNSVWRGHSDTETLLAGFSASA
jgi:asparagine synthase (glutamine-hydrolysing)